MGHWYSHWLGLEDGLEQGRVQAGKAPAVAEQQAGGWGHCIEDPLGEGALSEAQVVSTEQDQTEGGKWG